MSPLWTAAAAVAATGGRTQGDWSAGGLSIDTRSLQPGDLFIALSDRRDGHDFVADALAQGAAAALVSRVPDGLGPDAPLLLVPGVMDALRALARARRSETTARVVAVTGSVGKTTTKEMLRTALSAFGSVHAAEKSFNNHWGVPLTLARCPLDADFAVIEIGMNHPGEIAPLTALAQPDVALVTTVAAAHLEAFDSIAGIAHEKGSIFGGLRCGGTAVWNGDLDTSAILHAAASEGGRANLRFGRDPASDACLLATGAVPGGQNLRSRIAGAEVSGQLMAEGGHLAMNAVAALAAVHALGLDPAAALTALAGWRPGGGRGQRASIALPGGGAFTLIDEAYNANPASMAAALDVLAGVAPAPGGQRIAILGDMLELGPDEARLHAELADLPAMQAIGRVHCVGPRMAHLWAALPEARRGLRAETAAELAARPLDLAGPGDVVTVKGSLGARVGLIVDALRGIGHRATQTVAGETE